MKKIILKYRPRERKSQYKKKDFSFKNKLQIHAKIFLQGFIFEKSFKKIEELIINHCDF